MSNKPTHNYCLPSTRTTYIFTRATDFSTERPTDFRAIDAALIATKRSTEHATLGPADATTNGPAFTTPFHETYEPTNGPAEHAAFDTAKWISFDEALSTAIDAAQ